jgi:hypothetical protein
MNHVSLGLERESLRERSAVMEPPFTPTLARLRMRMLAERKSGFGRPFAVRWVSPDPSGVDLNDPSGAEVQLWATLA